MSGYDPVSRWSCPPPAGVSSLLCAPGDISILRRHDSGPIPAQTCKQGNFMPESLPENIAAARDALGYDEVGWYPLTWIPILAEFIARQERFVLPGNENIA